MAIPFLCSLLIQLTKVGIAFPQQHSIHTNQTHKTHHSQNVILLSISSIFSETKQEIKKPGNIEIINRDSSITEPPGGLVGVEVSAVRKTVGSVKSPDKVIGAAIDRKIADDEEGRDYRRRRISGWGDLGIWWFRRGHCWAVEGD